MINKKIIKCSRAKNQKIK